MKRILTLASLLVLALTSCRREFKTPAWETNLNAPLISSDIGIEDLIPDSLIQVNADNSINLVFDEVLFSYGIDTLLGVADSTIKDSLFSIVPTTFSSGATLYSDYDNNTIQANGAELTQLNLKEGFIDYEVQSMVQDTTIVTYSITTGTIGGSPISLTVTIPPGSPSSPSIVTGTLDLAGAVMDLTGPLHDSYNTYQTFLSAKLAPGITGVSVPSATVLVRLKADFHGLKPSYIRGYFGNFTSNEPLQSYSLNFLNNVGSPALDLSQVDAKLKITNGMGADVRVHLDTLLGYKTTSGSSVLLSHSFIGQMLNFNRATDLGWYADPYVYEVNLNSSNSNIESLIELLPDVIKYKIGLELNPLGNVSAHTDFIYNNSKVELALNMNIPLNLIASQLKLSDTVNFDLGKYDGNGKILRGRVKFNVANGLPLKSTLRVQLLDENNMVIGNLLGPTAINGNVTSTALTSGSNSYQTVYADLTDDNILTAYRAKKLVIYTEFETTPAGTFVSIYNTQRFKTQISILADYLTQE
ncbi:MAG TPA: hypothetical protein VD905_09930 [Flavobacteriales bacterium]|nr:hypothetical protein [Flavobacteriales bacterium]